MSWMSRGARQGGDRRGSPALADLEWQGQGCKVTLEHIRDVMPAFRDEQGDRKRIRHRVGCGLRYARSTVI